MLYLKRKNVETLIISEQLKMYIYRAFTLIPSSQQPKYATKVNLYLPYCELLA